MLAERCDEVAGETGKIMIDPKNWNDVDEFVESLPADLRDRARSTILVWVLPDVPAASVAQAIEQARRGIEADHPEILAAR